MTSITIPSSATKIGESAFYSCNALTSVTIKGSITTFGENAFYNCDALTSVTIQNGVTAIGKGAFYDCSALTSITIPGSVTSIEETTFYNCDALTSVTIQGRVTSIGKSAFYDCDALKSITIPGSVTSFGESAFYDCDALTSVTLQNGVTSIGESAFYDCDALTSITIPGSVTSFGSEAFRDCDALTSVIIQDGVTSIGSNAFHDCDALTSVTIPGSVTSIGAGAFSGCKALTSITIPDSVTSIGSSAFYNCDALTSITIPDSVTSIGNSAFYNCDALTSITIPGSVTSIGDRAFSSCDALTSITIPDSVTSIGSYAFYNCDALTSITIPGSVTSIESYVFTGCDALTSVTIQNGVTSIGNDAFYNCDALTSVTIPGSVTSIGDLAFNSCDSLTSATIQDGVTSIGSQAFLDCIALTSITIPESVTYFGYAAFSGCSNLKTVYYGGTKAQWSAIWSDGSNNEVYRANIIYTTVLLSGSCGEGLTYKLTDQGVLTISGTGEMSGSVPADVECTAPWKAYTAQIKSVVINSGVASIADYAFTNCENLTSVTIPNTVTKIGSHAFWGCKSLTSVAIPTSVNSIADGAFSQCALTKVTIPEGITTIQAFTFADCHELTDITIPKSVRSIGNSAFLNCSNLQTVHYDGTKNAWKAIAIGDLNDSLLNAQIQTASCDLKITTQPQNVSAPLDANISFTVAATSSAAVSFQWQYKAAGSNTWANSPVSSSKTNKLSLTATANRNGMQYRCLVTDECGEQLISNTATLTVRILTITQQPKNVTAALGQNVTFTVKAEGTGLKYQWQYKSADSSSWKNSPADGNKTNTLKLAATANRKGMSYRCIITDTYGGKVTSNAATLYINDLKITQQPVNVTATPGQNVSFTVKATGTGLTYQWEYRSAGDTKWYTSPADGNKTNTLKLSATTNRKGMSYRCVITDANGNKLTSNAATLYINEFKITQQPVNVTAALGQNVTFTVKATGTGLTYQWEYRSAGDTKWYTSPADGNKTNTLKLAATTNRKGMSYRCIITDASGKKLTSNAATLYINEFKITQQPVNVTATPGQNVSFTVKATGTGLNYQWEYRSAGDTKWYTSPADGNKTNTLKLAATTNRKGMSYRCIITDATGKKLTSNVATLYINDFKITQQPVDVTANLGQNVTFTVKATGTGLTYQWEYRTAGTTTWKESPADGCKTNTLKLSATTNRKGMSYRCVITDASGKKLTSDVATLYISDFKITNQPISITANLGDTVSFSIKATGTGLTYQWEYLGVDSSTWKPSPAAGNTTNTLTLTATASRGGNQYRCVVTDVSGKTLTSMPAMLTIA